VGRHVDLAELGHPVEGCNIDGGSPHEVTLGAVGAERWDVEVLGKASHAGARPERGISASVVTSLALARVYRDGWFGKVVRNGCEGTSNVGSIGDRNGRSAGNATNVVTDFVLVKGEARSHNPAFVEEIVSAYREAFEAAAAEVRNQEGQCAEVRFESRLDYHPFRLPEDAPVVRRGLEAVRRAGLAGATRTTNGGLDANWMVRHGVPTITIGAGQRNVHTIEEYADLADFLGGCRVALAMATA
jgi:tripeptide aminopeptidase